MFRRFAFMSLAVAALAACGAGGLSSVPTSPGSVAETTILDETAATGAELAYKGLRLAAELAVDSGILRGAPAARVAELDRRAFEALGVARSTNQVVNASSYRAAIKEAEAAIASASAIIARARTQESTR